MSTVFPKWTNRLPTVLLGLVLGGLATVIGVIWYYFTPKFWRVGYMPTQPGAGFSHQIHVGALGMDCRYCHSHVEESAEANIPTVSTCMGCHAEGHVDDALYARAANVKFIRDAWTAGTRHDEIQQLMQGGRHAEAAAKQHEYEQQGLAIVPGGASIPWRRVHKLPDYVRNFPHHIHVAKGVSCYSCHGDILDMPVVYHAQPLSMGWCLECHRNPEPHLVPPEKVTDLAWVRNQLAKTGPDGAPNPPSEGETLLNVSTPGGHALLQQLREQPLHLAPQNCGACHY